MTTFFTADHHFGHKNVIGYQNRPFADVHEMNVELARRWNEKVGPKDTVYVLGDFLYGAPRRMADIFSRLHGDIHLIEGDHDQSSRKPALRDGYMSISPLKRVFVADEDAPKGRREITLCHYSMEVWHKSHWGTWHLYGHSHGRRPDVIDRLSFDIGVDCHDYYPLSYAEVKAIMDRKTWTPPFKHREKRT
jgi:calcineurin-like phosphoesterase family protein